MKSSKLFFMISRHGKDEYAHDVQNLGEINKFEYEYEHTNSADT